MFHIITSLQLHIFLYLTLLRHYLYISEIQNSPVYHKTEQINKNEDFN